MRFVEISSESIRNSRIPLFSSKFSKKTYNQHQLLILTLLKEYLSGDYRDTVDLVDLIRDQTENQYRFDTSFYDTPHIPQRISLFTFTRLPQPAHKNVYDWGERIPCNAIDSSGFTSSCASSSYS